MDKWMLNFYVFINGVSDENRICRVEGEISEALKNFINSYTDIGVSLKMTNQSEIEDETDIGKCTKCNSWVTDYTKPNFVEGLSVGAKIDGEWLCDEHLPEDHPCAF